MCFTRVNAFNWFHVGAPTAVDANCGEPVALCMRVCVCERAYWTAKAHTAHIGLSLSRSQALCWCEWVARESATVCVRVYISLCVCVRAHTHYLPFWLWMPVRNTFHTLNLIRREEKWATLSRLCEWVSETALAAQRLWVSVFVCGRVSAYGCVHVWVSECSNVLYVLKFYYNVLSRARGWGIAGVVVVVFDCSARSALHCLCVCACVCVQYACACLGCGLKFKFSFQMALASTALPCLCVCVYAYYFMIGAHASKYRLKTRAHHCVCVCVSVPPVCVWAM